MKFVVEALGLKVAGGKELALSLLTRLAKNRAHQFIFIVPDLPDYAELARSGVKCVVCRHRFGLAGRCYLLDHVVPRICLREQADALLCLGNLPPRTLQCPTVVLLQNAWLVGRDSVAERRLTTREKLVIAHGKRRYRKMVGRVHIVAQTPVVQNRLCRQVGLDPRKVAIIPNGVELPAKPPGPVPDVRQACAEPFTFLCLARYYAHKNMEILIDAFEMLPLYSRMSARCFLTISPAEHPGATKMLREVTVRHLENTIVNLGPVDRENLPRIFHRADALILPSLLESHSRTYLEAMTFGLPIATSDRDFARHACRDAALYFDPLDPCSVARAMAQIIEDGALRRRLAANGRAALAEAPDWNQLSLRFVHALDRAARGVWSDSERSEECHIQAASVTTS